MNKPAAHTYRPPKDSGLDIIYQDANLIALNKPSGLLAVPGRGDSKRDSLAWRVQQRFPQARVVHRLDMETSGLMLMALNDDMQREASLLFQNRQIEKSYIAVVTGIICQEAGTIELGISADWPNRPLQKIDQVQGKPAITHYQVIARDPESHTSRLLLSPQTGRTHQLRVHMLALGHSILGDSLYAEPHTANRADRLMLHATRLRFRHPVAGKMLELVCEPDF
jgi:tRNA pseudouridine32 synthase/23S rRNA pseudouridine746 synthase